MFRVFGQPQAVLHETLKPVQPQDFNREPDLERPKPPGQCQAAVGEIYLTLMPFDVLKVIGAHAEGFTKALSVAYEHGTRLKRLREPLVRIKSDRIGPRNA